MQTVLIEREIKTAMDVEVGKGLTHTCFMTKDKSSFCGEQAQSTCLLFSGTAQPCETGSVHPSIAC